MRTTTLGAVLSSLAITAGTVAVITAGPTQAAVAATPTQVTLALSGKTTLVAPYKTDLGPLSGQVTDNEDNLVSSGDAVLQRRLPGKKWKNARTDHSPSFVTYGGYGSHALGNVQYRVHYLGGSDGTTTWAPSYSDVVTVGTQWLLHENGTCDGGCRFFGKLSPKAKHRKVVIEVKHGSWKRYKVVRTNARSKWSASVVATFGKGTLYRAVVGRSTHEIATSSAIYRFYKVRTS
jgi:hypothetical protein